MVKIIPVLILLALALTARAQTFTWTGTPGAQGYVILHGTRPDGFYEMWPVGLATNVINTNTLPVGTNWFTVAAFAITNGALWVSMCSNMGSCVVTSELVVDQVILDSTNLIDWQPWQTNRMLLVPQYTAQFFKAGAMSIRRTNIVTIPPMP